MIPWKKHARTIGLDVGTRWVKAVQIAFQGPSTTIERAVLVPRRKSVADLEECERIMGVLWRQDFAAASMVITLPTSDLLTMTMELPPRDSGAPLDHIARGELARAHKVSPDALEMAWWTLPGGQRASEGTHAMAMGCTHQHAETLVEGLTRGGARVLALEPGPIALARAGLQGADSNGLTALLDIAWTASSINLLMDGMIVYRRTLGELGLASLTKELTRAAALASAQDSEDVLIELCGADAGRSVSGDASSEGLPSSLGPLVGQLGEQLADELAMALNYAERRFDASVRRLLIAGGGASLPGVCDTLGTRSGVAASVIAPLSIAGITTSGDCGQGARLTAMTQALGAAIRDRDSAVRKAAA